MRCSSSCISSCNPVSAAAETLPVTWIFEMSDVVIAAAHDPDSIALESVNWRLAAGAYWAVGGLPGSGKSLLLGTAAALLRPVRGSQRLFGCDVATLTGDDLSQVRQRIG